LLRHQLNVLRRRVPSTPKLAVADRLIFVDRRTRATLEIKAFDTSVLTGVKPTGVLLDGLHEIAKVPAAERLIGQLRGGLLPNPEGSLMFITTQSDEPPRGAFRSELMVARAIRDGRSQAAMLPLLFEFRRTFRTIAVTRQRGRIPRTGGWWPPTATGLCRSPVSKKTGREQS